MVATLMVWVLAVFCFACFVYVLVDLVTEGLGRDTVIASLFGAISLIGIVLQQTEADDDHTPTPAPSPTATQSPTPSPTSTATPTPDPCPAAARTEVAAATFGGDASRWVRDGFLWRFQADPGSPEIMLTVPDGMEANWY